MLIVINIIFRDFICPKYHPFVLFSVVEQVELSASLYASSIQGHHLCALVKQLPVSK